MRKLIVLTLLTLAIPAAALAGGTPAQNAAAQAACQAQRTLLGTATFNLTYVGTTNANRANAFGKCVSTAVKNAVANTAAANTSCKTAQAAGLAAFKAVTASAANHANQAATTAAAKSCATERAAGPAAFTTKYGTGASKTNAFGKCVSSKVKTTP